MSIDELLERTSPVPLCGCRLWTEGATGLDYPQMVIDGAVRYTHRVMLALKLGRPLQRNEHALHECDVPLCIAPDHLFLGTHQDNMRDKCVKGRNGIVRGEASGMSKLTQEQVFAIRGRYAGGGVTHRGLASEFHVSHRTIGDVINRKVWSHV